MELKEKQVYVGESKTFVGLPIHIRILAVKEGWVMYRHKGAMPGVHQEKDIIEFINKHELKLK